jgi:hypothetical protein
MEGAIANQSDNNCRYLLEEISATMGRLPVSFCEETFIRLQLCQPVKARNHLSGNSGFFFKPQRALQVPPANAIECVKIAPSDSNNEKMDKMRINSLQNDCLRCR